MSASLTTYKHNSAGIKCEYLNGQLYHIEIMSTCDKVAWDALRHDIAFLESDIPGDYKKVRTSAAKEKIALFCVGYKAWSLHKTNKELAYKVSRSDAGMIKNINITQDLLRVFFLTDFWTKEKSISNYVKHYNEIQRIAATKVAAGSENQPNEMGQSLQKWFQ